MPRRFLKYTLILLILIACIVAGYTYFHHRSLYPSTDNAYVKANIVNIAAQVSGPIATIYVKNNEHVTKGQLLLQINPTPFEIEVAKATAELDNVKQQIASQQAEVAADKAKVTASQAKLKYATEQARRTIDLVRHQYAPKASGDQVYNQQQVAKAELNAARNQVQAAEKALGNSNIASNLKVKIAETQLSMAKLNLAYTKVYAPADGYLANFNLRQGSMITQNTPLFSLIEDNHWWVNANFKETQLSRIQPGQVVDVKVDMYPDHIFKGIVQSISYGSGSTFSLLPPENATGNWVKITQRFPVKIVINDIDPKFPLRIGASTAVTVDTQRSTTLYGK